MARVTDGPSRITAGTPYYIDVRVGPGEQPRLLIENSFAATVVTGKKTKEGLRFWFPEPYVEQEGRCSWKLIDQHHILMQGHIEVLPMTQDLTMEAYLGPKTIVVGGEDYSEMIVAPVDPYDNPMPNNWPVTIKNQLLGA